MKLNIHANMHHKASDESCKAQIYIGYNDTARIFQLFKLVINEEYDEAELEDKDGGGLQEQIR